MQYNVESSSSEPRCSISWPAQNLQSLHIHGRSDNEHRKSAVLVESHVNRTSKPSHVLFAGSSSFLECTRFQADTDSFQELSLKCGITQLDLWGAISNSSNIQVLLGGRVTALTLSCTSFQHLRTGLAQNSTLQSVHLPTQFEARPQATSYTFKWHPNTYNHFKADMPDRCVLTVISNQNLLLHFAILLFLSQQLAAFEEDELRFICWHFVHLFAMIGRMLRFCFRCWNPFWHHFLQWSFGLILSI